MYIYFGPVPHISFTELNHQTCTHTTLREVKMPQYIHDGVVVLHHLTLDIESLYCFNLNAASANLVLRLCRRS